MQAPPGRAPEDGGDPARNDGTSAVCDDPDAKPIVNPLSFNRGTHTPQMGSGAGMEDPLGQEPVAGTGVPPAPNAVPYAASRPGIPHHGARANVPGKAHHHWADRLAAQQSIAAGQPSLLGTLEKIKAGDSGGLVWRNSSRPPTAAPHSASIAEPLRHGGRFGAWDQRLQTGVSPRADDGTALGSQLGAALPNQPRPSLGEVGSGLGGAAIAALELSGLDLGLREDVDVDGTISPASFGHLDVQSGQDTSHILQRGAANSNNHSGKPTKVQVRRGI